MTGHLTFGNAPVPWTASWSAEESFSLGPCRSAPHLGPAILQAEAQGQGRPLFAKPHAIRQREVIAQGLCDLCGRSLEARTKVSLSHASVRLDGARGPCVMQVEPLLHRECAAISARTCPALRRDLRDGSLRVRQVGRYEVQLARMSKAYCLEIAGEAREALGHAKVVLLSWKDRDAKWLGLDDFPTPLAAESEHLAAISGPIPTPAGEGE